MLQTWHKIALGIGAVIGIVIFICWLGSKDDEDDDDWPYEGGGHEYN